MKERNIKIKNGRKGKKEKERKKRKVKKRKKGNIGRGILSLFKTKVIVTVNTKKRIVV